FVDNRMRHFGCCRGCRNAGAPALDFQGYEIAFATGRARRRQPVGALEGTGGDQPMSASRVVFTALCAALATLLMPWAASRAADPIKVGFSMALTGGVAPNGKQNLLALEIWRDDVNARGGLLGRPVELVYYDDQSNPNNVPGIYTKLLSVDNVDLLLGPYATNM